MSSSVNSRRRSFCIDQPMKYATSTAPIARTESCQSRKYTCSGENIRLSNRRSKWASVCVSSLAAKIWSFTMRVRRSSATRMAPGEMVSPYFSTNAGKCSWYWGSASRYSGLSAAGSHVSDAKASFCQKRVWSAAAASIVARASSGVQPTT